MTPGEKVTDSGRYDILRIHWLYNRNVRLKRNEKRESYQLWAGDTTKTKKATLVALFMCPGTELNRYDRCGSQDFKSCVSTNSTTGASI